VADCRQAHDYDHQFNKNNSQLIQESTGEDKDQLLKIYILIFVSHGYFDLLKY
jgi:hypothetical protein